ncbi:MAG: ribonuclease Z [Candidatus Pacearchaeota archaeon]
MEEIKVIFLGTSASAPTKERNHTSILIIFKGNYIMFDCGEGTQRQLKKANISPLRINKIFITHLHADHILGLAGLLQTMALNNYEKCLEIYGPRGIKNYINFITSFFPIIKKIKISINEIVKKEGKIEFDDFFIYYKKLVHTTDVYGYSFNEKDKIKIKEKYVKMIGPSILFKKLKQGKSIIFKGKKITPKEATYKIKGRKISIILDTKKCDNIFDLSKDSDLLIIECVYKSELQDLAESYFHLTTNDVIEIIKKSKTKINFITHISERYEGKEEELLKEIKKEIKNVFLAKDLEIINI